MSRSHPSTIEENKQATAAGTAATEKHTRTITQTAKPQKHAYTHKKIGDILDEVNDLLSHKREQVATKASEKVHHMLDELKSLYTDLKQMNDSPQNVDPLVLKHKQNQLNGIENKAVQGVYGAQAKICPLDQHGQAAHHVRIEAIPPGQATVRDMIEQCHQLVTRIMDRLEETVISLSGSEHGTSTAATTTTVHTGGEGQGHIQTHGTGDTFTEGTEKPKTTTTSQDPHVALP